MQLRALFLNPALNRGNKRHVTLVYLLHNLADSSATTERHEAHSFPILPSLPPLLLPLSLLSPFLPSLFPTLSFDNQPFVPSQRQRRKEGQTNTQPSTREGNEGGLVKVKTRRKGIKGEERRQSERTELLPYLLSFSPILFLLVVLRASAATREPFVNQSPPSSTLSFLLFFLSILLRLSRSESIFSRRRAPCPRYSSTTDSRQPSPTFLHIHSPSPYCLHLTSDLSIIASIVPCILH